MKTKSLFFSLLLTAAAFTFSNCGGDKTKATSGELEKTASEEHASGSTAAIEVTPPQFTVDAAFQHQLSSIFAAYVGLKEAFVSSEISKVGAEAVATRQSLAGADMTLLSGAAHNDWMNYRSGMETSLKAIESSTDIEVQREAFRTLSENLYKSIKAYGLGGATAYYEFCPMAFDNQGGFWLSDAEEIRNPYFGDKMLNCGTVKEKLN